MKRQSPLVSIVLPNLNYLPFLEERTASILSQTHSNWECIVIDGCSTDGSWSFFQKTAALDPRFRIFQEPPKGIYDAWNKGIERSRGEFVHIATSDDTMRPDFIGKMLTALEACPSAGIAHCCLTLIDENGRPLPQKAQWTQWKKVQFYGDWIRKYHLRRCPFDAIVHAGFSTVYSSVIQLLIRKTLFQKVGLFTDRFGSESDFEWGLRATMTTDTVHVPHYLSSWRIHPNQATANHFHNTSAFFEKLLLMVDAAWKSNRGFDVPRNDLKRFYFARYMGRLGNELDSQYPLRRLSMLTRGAKLSFPLTIRYLMNKAVHRRNTKIDAAEVVMSLLARFPEARIEPVPKLSLAGGD